MFDVCTDRQRAPGSSKGGPGPRTLVPILCGLAIGSAPMAGLAQSHGSFTSPDAPAAKDDAYPIGPYLRTTPEMARSIARFFAEKVAVEEFGVPTEHAAEVSELLARRIMALAHELGPNACRLIEDTLTEIFRNEAQDNRAPLSPEFQQEFAQRLKPLLKPIHGMIAGMARDIRPKLPMTKQLELAGNMMAFQTAFDAFADQVDRFARGDVGPEESLFGLPREPTIELDENGQSAQLRNALKTADHATTQAGRRGWEKYMREAAAFYDFDDAQLTAAESVLREYTQRADDLTYDEAMQDRKYRCHMLQIMLLAMDGHAARHPLLQFLVRVPLHEVSEQINQLDREFKRQIERIPTHAQRQAAFARENARLAERGIEVPS